MAETRTYEMTEEITLGQLGDALEQYLSGSHNLRTQKFEMNGRTVIQCTGDEAQWKKFLGMDAAVTAELKEEDHILTVTVGNAKWLDKMGVATIGAIYFWPLMVAAGIGALRQTSLPEEIYDFIEGRLLSRDSARDRINAPKCPDCGRILQIGDAFCPGCGRKLT